MVLPFDPNGTRSASFGAPVTFSPEILKVMAGEAQIENID